jgi:hypothetical protein
VKLVCESLPRAYRETPSPLVYAMAHFQLRSTFEFELAHASILVATAFRCLIQHV